MPKETWTDRETGDRYLRTPKGLKGPLRDADGFDWRFAPVAALLLAAFGGLAWTFGRVVGAW